VAAGSRYNIQVLEKAIRILNVLADGKRHTLGELNQALGISTSTIFRILDTLVNLNYVARDEHQNGYRLGLKCLELSIAYYESDDLPKVALPDLEWLRDKTSETVHLGVLDQMEVVYLEKLHGNHAVGLMSSRVGWRAPSYCTGLGKALITYEDPEKVRKHFERADFTVYTPKTIYSLPELLGQLETVRKCGYAFDLGEHEPEVRCVAAPILGVSGRAIAAISVSGPASRMGSLGDDSPFVKYVTAAASRISRKLYQVGREWAEAEESTG
jgi:IclR family KDG regulon transcriptional repressor